MMVAWYVTASNIGYSFGKEERSQGKGGDLREQIQPDLDKTKEVK